ncbi:26S proteasome regulatory subunit 6A homolog [Nicotiana sylvestris]|uniref:26S proteasome regulatory subunit 6A homolog n=1 Tax=Nicotiana sylvestris TaxID=4096 RepID=UPI00388C6B64
MATPMAAEDGNFEDDLYAMSTDDIIRAARLLDNEIRILKEELQRTNLELDSFKEKIKENQEKIKLNKQLPYLVGNIVEILEMNPEEEDEEDGANIDLDSQRKGKCVVLKTSTRQTIFLPVVGLALRGNTLILLLMFIGDGAKLVRDAFQLAKEKSPCIIFIDEIDAIGTKRFDSEVSGDREVQRTMLELLNQLDGFSSDDRIKVIAATNRADILDPALMRSGRLDRKIEFPHPTEEARARILQIHSRKMNVHPDVNFEELARSTDDFNGAQLKAVCVEAGMLALRRDATEVTHEDFNEGIIQVQAKKKASLNYYA